MANMKAEDEKAYDNFLERDPTRFCKAFISTQCVSDMIDNNVLETFNSYILNARGKHIIHMLEEIRSGLRERQYKKKQHVMSLTDLITLAVRKKIEKFKSLARFCTPHPGLGGKFEVKRHEDRFIVSLNDRTYSCRVWELTGILCVHDVSALHFMKDDPASYVHNYLTTETYLKAYSFALEPINGEKLWPKVTGYPVEPPLVRVMPGRPKKKRRRDKDEKDPKNPLRLRRLGVMMTCQKCLQEGHNARGCKNQAVQKPQVEKRMPGRPRKHPIADATAATPTSASARNKSIAKERRQARKGIGHYVSEETGNVRMSTQESQANT